MPSAVTHGGTEGGGSGILGSSFAASPPWTGLGIGRDGGVGPSVCPCEASLCHYSSACERKGARCPEWLAGFKNFKKIYKLNQRATNH